MPVALQCMLISSVYTPTPLRGQTTIFSDKKSKQTKNGTRETEETTIKRKKDRAIGWPQPVDDPLPLNTVHLIEYRFILKIVVVFEEVKGPQVYIVTLLFWQVNPFKVLFLFFIVFVSYLSPGRQGVLVHTLWLEQFLIFLNYLLLADV